MPPASAKEMLNKTTTLNAQLKQIFIDSGLEKRLTKLILAERADERRKVIEEVQKNGVLYVNISDYLQNLSKKMLK